MRKKPFWLVGLVLAAVVLATMLLPPIPKATKKHATHIQAVNSPLWTVTFTLTNNAAH